MLANSGSHLAIGSPKPSLPSSINIRAATEVTGLVIEAMRKMVSRAIGALVSRLARPLVVTWATSPWRQSSVTTPESRPWSMTLCIAGPILASSSRLKPLTFTAPSSMETSSRVVGDDSGERRPEPTAPLRQLGRFEGRDELAVGQDVALHRLHQRAEVGAAAEPERGIEGEHLEVIVVRAGERRWVRSVEADPAVFVPALDGSRRRLRRHALRQPVRLHVPDEPVDEWRRLRRIGVLEHHRVDPRARHGRPVQRRRKVIAVGGVLEVDRT